MQTSSFRTLPEKDAPKTALTYSGNSPDEDEEHLRKARMQLHNMAGT